ncbi:MAG: hypothetical protein IKW67_00410 [Alphaproteobacteria bacterium]|nr:hypothetical protein [Alphaproteobacteria bacterium]
MKRIIFYLAGMLFTVSCFADGTAPVEPWYRNGFQSGVGVSVTGGLNIFAGYHNPELSSPWLRYFGARIGLATTDPLKSAIDSMIERYMQDGRDVGDGVKIDEGKLDAWHGNVLVDYYPFRGSWRLTGGYVWGAMSLDSKIFGSIDEAPAQRFYFYLAGDHYYYNGNNFSGSAKIDWKYYGPYLGSGFDFDIFCGFSFFIDAGVVFTNRPARMDLEIPHEQLYIYNKETSSWGPVTIAALDRDVAAAEHDANRKLSDWRLYPMVKLGFAYRF